MENSKRDFGRFGSEAEWRAWQRDRARTLQRERRSGMLQTFQAHQAFTS